jgi:hypothetical protein
MVPGRLRTNGMHATPPWAAAAQSDALCVIDAFFMLGYPQDQQWDEGRGF